MGNNTKKSKLYFYQIVPLVEKKSLNEYNKLFSEAFKFKNDAYSTIPYSDGDISISKIERKHSNRYCLGTFIYNQKNNVPPKYDGINTKPLDLNLKEGLGYDCSFIFDSKTNIIALESKKPGVSLGAIIDFIDQNYDLPSFDFSMVIIPSEYENFLKSTEYYKIEYDIAKPTNSTGLKSDENSSLGNTIGVMEDLNALKGSIIYSVGRSRKRSLNLIQIRQFVQSLLRLNKREDFVKKLKITGTDNDSGGSKEFDLITNRLVEDIEVPKARVITKFFTKEKYRQIEALYLKHQPILIKLFKI
jgi:hypothetical protein